ncbi:uncharacterized protein PFL1_06111 [Pseudozyma flocculosa PF-1]|uniref:Transcription factor BYE1 n=1 Tax=Pseudozyma flocculosa PF-1 TaxID=1277687 RepID=A0A061H256_9BASI|nr:uncharacterized protein PFL1_06111 [Pseudozyma flocculosa PF-1]EPQ26463.1 hypothetical protein PFL1_06111 [Pseudozyma flocculosa PF-1]
MTTATAASASAAPAASASPEAGLDNHTEPLPSADGPRRGSRVKKPTRRALGQDAPQASTVASSDDPAARPTRRSSRIKHPEPQEPSKDANDGQGKSAPKPTKQAQDGAASVPAGGDEDQDDQDDDADDAVYCICKGKDDGTPMISCEGCHDWFHFSCVKLTKRAARNLSEYLCPSCLESGRGSKDDQGNTDGATKAKATADDERSDGQQSRASSAETTAAESSGDSGSEHVESGQEDAEDEEDEEDEDGGSGKATSCAKRSLPQSSRTPKRRRTDSDATAANHVDKAKAGRRPSVTAASPSEPRPRPGLSVGNAVKRKDSEAAAPSARQKSSNGTSLGSPTRRPSVSASKGAKAPSGTSRRNASGGAAPRASGLDEVEAARAPARRVITSVLETIFTDTSLAPIQNAGGTISLDVVEQSKSPGERAREYAEAFEQEMFELTAEQSGSTKAVGQKYREKFRTFLFSLKDRQNQGLHLRIASGQLLAKDLAHMSKDELANESIRQATEKAKQEALHRITLLKTEEGPHRKITHKGEIEIESDTFSSQDQGGKFAQARTENANVGGQAGAAISSSTEASTSQAPKPRSASTPQVEAPQPSASASADHRSSASPPSARGVVANVAGLEQDVGSSPASRTRALSATVLQSPTTKFDFSSVWSGSERVPSAGIAHGSADDAAGRYGLDGADDGAIDVFQPDFPPEVNLSQGDGSPFAGDPGGAAGDADDFIDTFLGGDEDASRPEVAEQESRPIRAAKTPEADPPSAWMHRYRPVIWAGSMVLPDVGYFCGLARQVAGQDVVGQPWVWPYFFPTSQSVIEGRLPSKMAADYLMQVRTSAKTRIIVFTLEANFDPIAVAPAGAEAVHSEAANTAAFAKVVEHFKSLDRWGVLHKSTRARDSGILKDVYLVPLQREDPVPLWLDLVESDALGPDWAQRRDRDLFLIPIVVYAGAIEHEAQRLARGKRRSVTQPEREASIDAQAGRSASSSATPVAPAALAAASLPPSLAQPAPPEAGITTTALQDLLRSISKSTSSLLEQGPTPPHQPAAASSTNMWSPMPAQHASNPDATPWSPLPPPPGPAPRPPPFLEKVGDSRGGNSPSQVASGPAGGGYDPHTGWAANPTAPPSAEGPPHRGWSGAPQASQYGPYGGGAGQEGPATSARWNPGFAGQAPPPPPAAMGYHGPSAPAYPPPGSGTHGPPYGGPDSRGAHGPPPAGWTGQPAVGGSPYGAHGRGDQPSRGVGGGWGRGCGRF